VVETFMKSVEKIRICFQSATSPDCLSMFCVSESDMCSSVTQKITHC
jgi:hypothetical protein